jgi:hypothetical protein
MRLISSLSCIVTRTVGGRARPPSAALATLD